VRTEEGKLYLFVAIDRTSKVAFARLLAKANTATAVTFLDELIEAIPYKINVVLTDNGIQFADLPKNRSGPTATWRRHPFDRACHRHGIEHRLTKPNHPWKNGQVERMNRTLKEATVQRYYYESHEQLRAHLADFLAAYNFAKRLKTLRGLTPHEYVCNASGSTQSITPRDCTLTHVLQQLRGVAGQVNVGSAYARLKVHVSSLRVIEIECVRASELGKRKSTHFHPMLCIQTSSWRSGRTQKRL
jgi:transposase-like protein